MALCTVISGGKRAFESSELCKPLTQDLLRHTHTHLNSSVWSLQIVQLSGIQPFPLQDQLSGCVLLLLAVCLQLCFLCLQDADSQLRYRSH